MKITLTNGTELAPYQVIGGRRTVHGFSRDALSFIFPTTEDIVTIDGLFNATNCEHITIEDENGGVFIHDGYTVRAELSKHSVQVEQENPEEPPVFEDRITVVMAQRTYMESELAETREALEMILSGVTE